MQSLPSLSQHIPSQLTHSSLLASKAAVDFGETVEQILIKYGKRITGLFLLVIYLKFKKKRKNC